jgi:hypothetical protein
MSDERELKLECLKLAGGNIEHAEQMLNWISAPRPYAEDGLSGWAMIEHAINLMPEEIRERARAALHPPVDSGGGGETETPSVLSEFMKRPGAVAVERGEMIEINKEPCHWLYGSGHIQTATNPTIIWRNTEYPGPIIAYAPVIPADTTTQNAAIEAPPVPALETSDTGEGKTNALDETLWATGVSEGRAARDEGKPRAENPYPCPSEMYEAWNRGWEVRDDEVTYPGDAADDTPTTIPPSTDEQSDPPTKPTEYRDLAHYLGEKVLEEAAPKEPIISEHTRWGWFGGKPKVEA